MAPLLRRAATLVVVLGSFSVLAACGGDGGTTEVDTRVAASVSTTPEFITVDVGGSRPVAAEVRDSAGVLISNPAATWWSLSAVTATVDGSGASGSVRGVAPGITRVIAQVNTAADTTLVASLGTRSLLSTSFVNGLPNATATPGQIVQVPVMLDMSRVGANGDLGSAQFDLQFNPALLVYQGAVAGVEGVATFSVPNPGRFRFSFNGAVPQGRSNLTLVTLTFLVPQSAPTEVNNNTVLVMNHTAAPASTTGQPYELPVTAWGRLRVTR